MGPLRRPSHVVVRAAGCAKRAGGSAVNDPNGTVLPRIPVLQMSGSPYVPQQGHVVQLLQIGNTLAVLGRQNRPSGIVTFE